ncbi:DNA-3-methyladenine glycosylase [Labilibacter marinus]|uniref:DNA-3-methyladenine glycosylase n=1 Tax=Labilibacter marinus TaxID=1477105 RepID=UPI00094FEFAC|nr:DNA-3-methyladenine glycosylase [Labilibacter marinus]
MRVPSEFLQQDAVELAQQLIGKTLVRKFEDGTELRKIITETEAYCGEEDLACHASKGRTARTEVMYHQGGKVYVYLIYGIHWMLNFVCGIENKPQAVLIRGINKISGPGRVGKALKIDKSFYGEDTHSSQRIWIEDTYPQKKHMIKRDRRIGIDYAGEVWANKLWRFYI